MPTASTAGLTVVELADAYHEFCKGYYRKKDGTPSGWLDHIQLVLDKHLAELVRPHSGRRLRPQGFQGHPATAGRRRQFPPLREQVDADRDQVFQVGGGAKN